MPSRGHLKPSCASPTSQSTRYHARQDTSRQERQEPEGLLAARNKKGGPTYMGITDSTHATYTLHTTSCNCTPYTAHYVLHAATCTNVLPQSLCHLFSCSSTLHDGRGTLSSCSNNPPRKNKTGLLMLRLSKAATSRGCYVLKALYLESPLRKANPALFGRRNPLVCKLLALSAPLSPRTSGGEMQEPASPLRKANPALFGRRNP